MLPDELAYPLTRPPLIRAGTTRLRFDFTAPALSRPERSATYTGRRATTVSGCAP